MIRDICQMMPILSVSEGNLLAEIECNNPMYKSCAVRLKHSLGSSDVYYTPEDEIC